MWVLSSVGLSWMVGSTCHGSHLGRNLPGRTVLEAFLHRQEVRLAEYKGPCHLGNSGA
jgi:hypothetical protein